MIVAISRNNIVTLTLIAPASDRFDGLDRKRGAMCLVGLGRSHFILNAEFAS